MDRGDREVWKGLQVPTRVLGIRVCSKVWQDDDAEYGAELRMQADGPRCLLFHKDMALVEDPKLKEYARA